MHFFSPLRYPGGKGKLSCFIKHVFKHNDLNDGTYVEPYAGGAAVALSLLLEGYAWKIIINDLDPLVHAFWWAILNDNEYLCQLISNTPVTIETWHQQKSIHANPRDYSLTKIGFATFFLNRTNRSGILKAGVIGGQRQNGPYKLDARYNKENLLERIRLISKYRGRIELHNLDAFDLINNLSTSLNSKSLLYLDPPYFIKGKLLYQNCYTPTDHARIASLIKTVSTPWMVTYDNTPEVRKLYASQQQIEFDISYSAHLARPRGKEVMIYNNLNLPSLPYARRSSQSEPNLKTG